MKIDLKKPERRQIAVALRFMRNALDLGGSKNMELRRLEKKVFR